MNKKARLGGKKLATKEKIGDPSWQYETFLDSSGEISMVKPKKRTKERKEIVSAVLIMNCAGESSEMTSLGPETDSRPDIST